MLRKIEKQPNGKDEPYISQCVCGLRRFAPIANDHLYDSWLSLRKPFKKYLFIFRGFEGRHLPNSSPAEMRLMTSVVWIQIFLVK